MTSSHSEGTLQQVAEEAYLRLIGGPQSGVDTSYPPLHLWDTGPVSQQAFEDEEDEQLEVRWNQEPLSNQEESACGY